MKMCQSFTVETKVLLNRVADGGLRTQAQLQQPLGSVFEWLLHNTSFKDFKDIVNTILYGFW